VRVGWPRSAVGAGSGLSEGILAPVMNGRLIEDAFSPPNESVFVSPALIVSSSQPGLSPPGAVTVSRIREPVRNA